MNETLKVYNEDSNINKELVDFCHRIPIIQSAIINRTFYSYDRTNSYNYCIDKQYNKKDSSLESSNDAIKDPYIPVIR